jgi:hypothetical protein
VLSRPGPQGKEEEVLKGLMYYMLSGYIAASTKLQELELFPLPVMADAFMVDMFEKLEDPHWVISYEPRDQWVGRYVANDGTQYVCLIPQFAIVIPPKGE